MKLFMMGCLFAGSVVWLIMLLRNAAREGRMLNQHEADLDEMYAAGVEHGRQQAQADAGMVPYCYTDAQMNRRARNHEIQELRG